MIISMAPSYNVVLFQNIIALVFYVLPCPLFALSGTVRNNFTPPVYTEDEVKGYKEYLRKLLTYVSNEVS